MRSDVRIGIAIGLVIILGVVVYFIFSNRPDKPTEQQATSSQPAPPKPFQITVAQGPLRPIPGSPTESPRPGSVDNLIASASGDKAKTDLAPVGPGKTDVAPVGPGKTDAKTPDMWSVKPDAKRDVKPEPPVDPVEAQMRKEFDREGEVSMRSGGAPPANSRDLGATAVRNIDLALDSGSGVIKPEAAHRDAPRGETPKVETAKVGVGKGSGLDTILGPTPKNVPDETIGKILDTEAGKSSENASEAVRKGEYIVQAGDNGAYGIAKKVYGNVRLGGLVMDANPGLNWHRLKPGDKIKIRPAPVKTPPAGKVGDGTVGLGTLVPPADDKSKYTVKSGDTGEKISKSVYGESKYWGDIEKVNPGVNPRRLQVGSILTIPPRPAGATTRSSGGSTGGTDYLIDRAGSVSTDDKSKYTVKSGDTGEKISKSVYGESKYWADIEKANPGVSATRLRVGAVLTIPPKPAGATTRASGRTTTADSGAGVPMGKAAARRAAAAKLAAENPPVAKKTVAKKPVAEKPSSEETGSSEEPAPVGGGSSGGGNGFD